MKRIFYCIAALLVLTVAACKKDKVEPKAAPEIVWNSNPDFSVVELAPEMDVNVTLNAEAGIKGVIVTVDSDVLEPAISMMTTSGTPVMDFVNDEKLISTMEALLGGSIPMGDKLVGQTSVQLDLSKLVPMILALSPERDSDHIFKVELSDSENRSVSKDLKFHYTGSAPEVSYNVKNIDLWANSAEIEVGGVSADYEIAVNYREKGASEWIAVQKNGEGKYVVSAEWESSKNEAGLDVFTPKDGTGIFAGKTYEVEISNAADGVLASGEFVSSEKGDVIPNSDMSGWSKVTLEEYPDKPVDSPNPEGESFWASANIPLAPTLCSNDNGSALLASQSTFGILASGNIFAGSFQSAGIAGIASFGQEYAWTARPKALKVKVKYTTFNMDHFGSSDPQKDELKETKPMDKARVYAVVTDWTGRHSVKSGLGVQPADMNVWDPASQTSTDEGKILGYASQMLEGEQNEFVEVVIPFCWYDTESMPSEGSISLGIACCTSTRGDYLTGSKDNKIWVDDFEWVY